MKRFRHDAQLLEDLESVLDLLVQDKTLPTRLKDHPLAGNLKNFRELHLRPDTLLVYQKDTECVALLLLDTGSHAQLF